MGSIKIKDVTNYLESLAPLAYQETYDNAGLITGHPEDDVIGILVTLDCIEEVVEEAIHINCNLIIAHHPIIFKGLKKLTASNYIERTIIKAIKNNIAIYAIHTNLDNVHTGVNKMIADKIGLRDLKIISPRKDLLTKLTTFIPHENTESVMAALYKEGVGQIGNYKNCSFQVEGIGTFMPTERAKPHTGNANIQEVVNEVRAEIIFPSYLESRVIKTLKKAHPYEEVAYYLTPLRNDNQEVGAGMVGELEYPIEPLDFLKRLKISMDLKVVRYTKLLKKPVKTIAVCGGSGSFLLSKVIQTGADVFITADFKYHEFFDAEEKLIIADIGHYESEVFTKDLLKSVLMEKFHSFAINFSKTVTNPISYL